MTARIGLLSLPLAMCASSLAQAAGGTDNCTGYIDTLPAAISTPGTWCLRQNQTVALASGSLIRVNADNVVVDCNRHEVDGTAAGAGTQAVGVAGYSRRNVTVRRCGLSGMLTGILLTGGGHRVEGNRVTRSRFRGIYVASEDGQATSSQVVGNTVLDTGGAATQGFAAAIYTQGGIDIIDNTVVGVIPTTQAGAGTRGIYSGSWSFYSKGLIERNRVSQLTKPPEGTASYGIEFSVRMTVRDNHVVSGFSGPGHWLIRGLASNSPSNVCVGNTVLGFTQPIAECPQQANNVVDYL